MTAGAGQSRAALSGRATSTWTAAAARARGYALQIALMKRSAMNRPDG